ncbi:hypothetical protein ACWD5R_21480 [Streptomyces sp. NPDC002514]|uniref:hypothetical protein n=1 Tax=Streptomyces sp. NPDC001270 TaxID=3364554 RepID=UPI0036AA0856
MLTGRNEDRRRARRLLPALLLLAVAATAVWLLWPDDRPSDAPRAGGSRVSGPRAGTSRAGAPTTAGCSAVDLTGVGGRRAVAGWRAVVEPVHRAACAGDFTALSWLLGGGRPKDFLTEECAGCGAADIVAMWRDEYGLDPAALARLLESPPVVDQGGLTYEHGDMVAVFGRGTSQLPGGWSAFFVRCHEDDTCAALLPSG